MREWVVLFNEIISHPQEYNNEEYSNYANAGYFAGFKDEDDEKYIKMVEAIYNQLGK